MEALAYALLAVVAAALGALGGLGGAIILVPALVVAGLSAAEAAPLGLLSVAAGSVAAGAHHLRDRSVNHRLGVTTELPASAGAVTGAMLSGVISDRLLTLLLAGVAVAAAAAGLARGGVLRNPPDAACRPCDVGERVGLLSGAYPLADGIVPYVPRRLAAGLSLMAVAGVVAGMAGASGGFIKTPATSEIMGVPMRVAAATTTFTVGITSSAALIVFALQGRIDPSWSAAVIAGSLVGGQVGARFQARLHPASVRRTLSILLLVVAVVLVARSVTELRGPIPPGVVSTIRGRWQRPALTLLTTSALVLSTVATVLPGRAGDVLGVAVVAAVVAAPLLRVGWLVFRWWQEGDRRFVLTGAALLAIVGTGALLTVAGVGR